MDPLCPHLAGEKVAERCMLAFAIDIIALCIWRQSGGSDACGALQGRRLRALVILLRLQAGNKGLLSRARPWGHGCVGAAAAHCHLLKKLSSACIQSFELQLSQGVTRCSAKGWHAVLNRSKRAPAPEHDMT